MIKSVAVAIDRVLLRVAARSRFLALLYYVAWSWAFCREQQAVLFGRLEYHNDVRRPSEGIAFLRRSIHRLEKGLLMRPRRRIFGVEYIEQTVDCYETILKNPARERTSESTEVNWSHDVLCAYFEVTGGHPAIDQSRLRFKALPQPDRCTDGRLVPYKRDLSCESPVSYEDLSKLSVRRRSVRWFLHKAVPRDVVDKAIDVAAQSPTACNRQPFVFRVFDDPQLVREVAQLPMGTSGFHDNIPTMVIIIGRLRNYPDERDRHLIYIDSALAAMGFVYAIESQGLSSCCINWPDIDDRGRRVASVVGLAPDERPILCIAVGYPDPDGLVASSQKKPLEQLRRFNFE